MGLHKSFVFAIEFYVRNEILSQWRFIICVTGLHKSFMCIGVSVDAPTNLREVRFSGVAFSTMGWQSVVSAWVCLGQSH